MPKYPDSDIFFPLLITATLLQWGQNFLLFILWKAIIIELHLGYRLVSEGIAVVLEEQRQAILEQQPLVLL